MWSNWLFKHVDVLEMKGTMVLWTGRLFAIQFNKTRVWPYDAVWCLLEFDYRHQGDMKQYISHFWIACNLCWEEPTWSSGWFIHHDCLRNSRLIHLFYSRIQYGKHMMKSLESHSGVFIFVIIQTCTIHLKHLTQKIHILWHIPSAMSRSSTFPPHYRALLMQQDEFTPLHWAAFKNCREVAALLISRGAIIEAKTKKVCIEQYRLT